MPRKRRTSKLVALNLTLAETHPGKLNFWDYKRNKISPQNLTFGCSDLVWWICPQDPSHRWQQQIVDFCKRQVKTGSTESLGYPEVAEEWHPSRNSKLTPQDVSAGSNKKVFWRCRNNQRHIWEATITNRTGNKSGCPHCHKAGVRRTRK